LPVAEALKTLSEDERQVILLHAVSGFKHRETASLLGLPLGSVLSLHSRARKKLKKHLQEGDEI
ncbi:MAG: RNA polymerase sigma factor, partial [Clostridia bacterium]|nr:RNA polymerase sigma factor [Clostridia bacterium]